MEDHLRARVQARALVEDRLRARVQARALVEDHLRARVQARALVEDHLRARVQARALVEDHLRARVQARALVQVQDRFQRPPNLIIFLDRKELDELTQNGRGQLPLAKAQIKKQSLTLERRVATMTAATKKIVG